MIIIDSDLLVYAGVSSFAEHDRARTWLDDQLSGATPVGLPWQTLLAFLRVTTNAGIFRTPLRMGVAWDLARCWLSAGPAWIPVPTERHADIVDDLITSSISGNLVPDMHLAALAIEHGLTVCSNDRDFARFPKVRWFNPLQA